MECWDETYTEEQCCNLVHGPEGDPNCWGDSQYSFDYCCNPPSSSSFADLQLESWRGTGTAAECWDETYTEKQCCNLMYGPQGDANCWGDSQYGFDYCCNPPSRSGLAVLQHLDNWKATGMLSLPGVSEADMRTCVLAMALYSSKCIPVMFKALQVSLDKSRVIQRIGRLCVQDPCTRDVLEKVFVPEELQKRGELINGTFVQALVFSRAYMTPLDWSYLAPFIPLICLAPFAWQWQLNRPKRTASREIVLDLARLAATIWTLIWHAEQALTWRGNSGRVARYMATTLGNGAFIAMSAILLEERYCRRTIKSLPLTLLQRMVRVGSILALNAALVTTVAILRANEMDLMMHSPQHDDLIPDKKLFYKNNLLEPCCKSVVENGLLTDLRGRSFLHLAEPPLCNSGTWFFYYELRAWFIGNLVLAFPYCSYSLTALVPLAILASIPCELTFTGRKPAKENFGHLPSFLLELADSGLKLVPSYILNLALARLLRHRRKKQAIPMPAAALCSVGSLLGLLACAFFPIPFAQTPGYQSLLLQLLIEPFRGECLPKLQRLGGWGLFAWIAWIADRVDVLLVFNFLVYVILGTYQNQVLQVRCLEILGISGALLAFGLLAHYLVQLPAIMICSHFCKVCEVSANWLSSTLVRKAAEACIILGGFLHLACARKSKSDSELLVASTTDPQH
ncbi:unnamed protein product [Symbiodinium natans]|uniref:Uncharacterized protein n=1 Tax=Symbiodinium natans TaxID=878477 RepID=A0A812IKG0_9DINO|nr:unnamed protein product [Symbiodinium natans]